MPGEFVQVKQKNPRRTISEEEYQKLLENTDLDFKNVLVCGWESGMRSGEIANLKADKVHLDVSHISGTVVHYIDLGIFDTKTGARRTVPISPVLKEILARRLEGLKPEDYVFTYTWGDKVRKYNPGVIWIKMVKACENAKIEHGDKNLNERGERVGITFHCLRHTRISRWVMQGFSDEIIRRASGHRSLQSYQDYVKLDPAVVMRLVDLPRESTVSFVQTAKK